MKAHRALRLLAQLPNVRHSSSGVSKPLATYTKHVGYFLVTYCLPNWFLPYLQFEEISIPVPWGHISGKWYGPKHVRPIVGMHGWQDNAGTFDTLAPLLPSHLSFLSIDAPGHGLSSWLPAGTSYHSIDLVLIIRRLMDDYNWDKISILGHSMSSINGFVFSALFPDKVDLFIGLDLLLMDWRSDWRVHWNWSGDWRAALSRPRTTGISW